MKPFDTKGEYSPEEVKAALAGINGTRQLSFRYERLNKDNGFIEEIDAIQSCSIENNSLADIKRTSKFDILDTGTINYLQDRIKPYVRLVMPEDKSYDALTAEYSPDIWWKMDEPSILTYPFSTVYEPNAVNYATRETAYEVSTTGPQYNLNFRKGSATLRNESWIVARVDSPETLTFRMSSGSPIEDILFIVYYAESDDAPLEYLYSLQHYNGASGQETYVVPEPQRGNYYLRALTYGASTTQDQQPYLRITKGSRVQDSSANNFTGTIDGWTHMDQPGLVGEGSAAKSEWEVGSIALDDAAIDHDGMVITNFWAKFEPHASETFSVDIGIDLDGKNGEDWYASYYFNANETYFDGYLDLPGTWNGQFSVPSNFVFDGQPHMMTLIYQPSTERAEFWLDGKFAASFVDVYETGETLAVASHDFETSHVDQIDFWAYCSKSITVDEITFFTRPMPDTMLTKLYTEGIASSGVPTGRSGYVEWPQGVFVLSSPTRTMQDGNTVVRSVDGYDQLVNLKEDSFDYRYSVKTGAKYTEAIFQVLQSSKPKASYPFTEDFWSTTGNAQITSETSALLYTTDANQVSVYSGTYLTLKDIIVSAKVDGPTTPSTATTQMIITYLTPLNTYKSIWIGKEGTSLKFVDENGGSFGYTWNSITDAYWRMRESGGFMFFETSPDNTVWNERRKIKLTTDTYVPTNVQFTAAHGQALVGSAVSEVVVSGYGLVDADITKSASVLPTGMEWEPGTTKLAIINDLLAAINYQSATYDEDGTFVGRPYISPQQRTPGFRYATDAESVITGDVDQTVDIFAIPNKWVVVVSDPDRPMLVGEYTNDDPHSPTSTVSRGRTIVDYRTEQSAPDQLTLDAQAARLAFEASQVYEAIEFDTALMPIHQNNDVYELVIDGLAIDSKYSETSWSMELKNGAAMSHKVRRVVAV